VPDEDPPVFASSLRGYVRADVDRHVAAAARALRQERARAGSAEQSLAEARRGAEDAQRALGAERQRAHDLEQEVGRLREERDAVPAPVVRPTGPDDGPVPPSEREAGYVIRPAGEPLRRPGPSRRARPLAVEAAALAAALLVGGLVGAAIARGAADHDDAPASAAGPVASGPVPSGPPSSTVPATAGPAPTAAPAAVLRAAAVPRGWHVVRAPDRSWSVALPAGWRQVGTGSQLRFVSPSGLSTVSVRTAALSAPPDRAQLLGLEKSFAADHPGYRRLAVREMQLRGQLAASWDYTYGSGTSAQRVGATGVLLGMRGYLLQLQSQAASWRYASVLLPGLTGSFSAAS
jgi:hypothetical protein